MATEIGGPPDYMPHGRIGDVEGPNRGTLTRNARLAGVEPKDREAGFWETEDSFQETPLTEAGAANRLRSTSAACARLSSVSSAIRVGHVPRRTELSQRGQAAPRPRFPIQVRPGEGLRNDRGLSQKSRGAFLRGRGQDGSAPLYIGSSRGYTRSRNSQRLGDPGRLFLESAS
jgi:hypothetical protein